MGNSANGAVDGLEGWRGGRQRAADSSRLMRHWQMVTRGNIMEDRGTAEVGFIFKRTTCFNREVMGSAVEFGDDPKPYSSNVYVTSTEL